MSIEFVKDKEIYQRVILEKIPGTKRFLWIGTSDLKDLYVKQGLGMVPFLEVLSDLIKRGVEIRLIHAKEPGENYRKDFDKYPDLIEGMERVLCPRVHFKTVVVDGTFAYSGSANLTGAGMGAKSDKKRNFESGFVTDDPKIIEQIMEQFDSIWIGEGCKDCLRKQYCSDYQDILNP